MKNINVSVIIPLYNAVCEIMTCLHALINQTYPKNNYEIIVVNDGSYDGSEKVVKMFEEVILINQTHQGPGATRNNGASHAQGKIILFIDADCIAIPAWLEEMVKCFEEDSNIVGVQGAYKTDQKRLLARFSQIEFEERFEMLKKKDAIDFIGSFSVGFKKEFFQEAGGFKSHLIMNEDIDLSYRMTEIGGRLIFNPSAVVYHQHRETLWKYVRLKFWRGYWRTLVYREFPHKTVSDSYTPYSLKLQVVLIYILLFSVLSKICFSLSPHLISGTVAITCLTMVKFILFAVKRDFLVGLLSPLFLWARAVSIALGVGAGLIGMIRTRR
ncbi:MAG: glycosyltransferase [Desulfobacteraceae bacterium]|nr:glycosyltransferase [Desulfobacteraceae bacterium]MBC2718449.1 glycosyltransferase [Desulfobacteraceae bacterium]